MKSREQSIIHIVNEIIRNLGYAQEKNEDNDLLPGHYLDLLENIANIVCTRNKVYPKLLSDIIDFTNILEVEYLDDDYYRCYQNFLKS